VDPHSDPDHALYSLRDHRGLSLADRINKIAARFYLFLAAALPGLKIIVTELFSGNGEAEGATIHQLKW
jgi:hypothetical protein